MSGQPKSNTDKSSPLNSTKQLLDELDVLMQRMLALPVGEASGTAAVGASKPTSLLDELPEKIKAAPAPTSEGSVNGPTINCDAAVAPRSYVYEPDEAPDAESENHDAPAANKQTAVVRESRAPHEAAAPPAGSVSAETLASLTDLGSRLAEDPSLQRSRLLAAGAVRRQRWWLWPLAAANRVFDFATRALGPLGTWLREPVGRRFLGWLGIALWLAALALQITMWLLWQ